MVEATPCLVLLAAYRSCFPCSAVSELAAAWVSGPDQLIRRGPLLATWVKQGERGAVVRRLRSPWLINFGLHVGRGR